MTEKYSKEVREALPHEIKWGAPVTRGEHKQSFDELDKRIIELRGELKEDNAKLRAEFKEDIAKLRDELKDYIAKSQIRMLLAITAIFAGIAGSMLAGMLAIVR